MRHQKRPGIKVSPTELEVRLPPGASPREWYSLRSGVPNEVAKERVEATAQLFFRRRFFADQSIEQVNRYRRVSSKEWRYVDSEDDDDVNREREATDAFLLFGELPPPHSCRFRLTEVEKADVALLKPDVSERASFLREGRGFWNFLKERGVESSEESVESSEVDETSSSSESSTEAEEEKGISEDNEIPSLYPLSGHGNDSLKTSWRSQRVPLTSLVSYARELEQICACPPLQLALKGTLARDKGTPTHASCCAWMNDEVGHKPQAVNRWLSYFQRTPASPLDKNRSFDDVYATVSVAQLNQARKEALQSEEEKAKAAAKRKSPLALKPSAPLEKRTVAGGRYTITTGTA